MVRLHTEVRTSKETLIRVTPLGKYTVIYQFDNTHGAAPYAPVIQGADGNFYGTTTASGPAFGGVVFKLTLAGTLTVLYGFIQGSGPSVPYGGLVQAADGNFYGTTSQGGTLGDGTIFRISGKVSTPTYLYNFDKTTRLLPEDTLLQHTNGAFYGDTSEGR